MKKRDGKKRLCVKSGIILVALLCAVLGACAQTQVRGQYDVAIGGVHH